MARIQPKKISDNIIQRKIQKDYRVVGDKVLKHIVFVVGIYKNGGVERRSTTLANQFAEKGYKCTILVTQEISYKQFFHTEKNVEIVFLGDYAEACRKAHKDNSEKIIKTKMRTRSTNRANFSRRS
ncbi:MAG: hypothetical protein IJZ10_01265 [Thermoguttaceae bacterium]|nr:hypothetical protein [Thermoguttaceae bacterium]